ncbi:MAG: hypothetical protein LBU48_03420, partial [Coriobacteriales bacterium]|nr:hypothetical protein [Coriobacteriales bacterium]
MFSASIVVPFTVIETSTAVENDLVLVNDVADRLVSRDIELLKMEAQSIACHLGEVSLGGATLDDLEAFLTQRLSDTDYFIGLEIVARDRRIASAGQEDPSHEFLDNKYVQRAFEGEQVISTTIDDGTDGVVFHVCVPIEAFGGDKILLARVAAQHFSDVLNEFTVWQSGYFFILDEEGTIIASKDGNEVLTRKNYLEQYVQTKDEDLQSIADFTQDMITGGKGVGKLSLEGEELICAYRPITASKVGWIIGVDSPVDETPVITARNGLLILAGIIIVVGSLIA